MQGNGDGRNALIASFAKKGIAKGRKRLQNKVCMTRIMSDSQE
jgi:hypothetical protein